MDFLQRFLRFLFKGTHDIAVDSQCLFRIHTKTDITSLMMIQPEPDSCFEADRQFIMIKFKKIQNVINPHPSQAARVIIEGIFQYKLFRCNLLHIRMIFIFLNQFRGISISSTSN